jgi:hypothetical protein
MAGMRLTGIRIRRKREGARAAQNAEEPPSGVRLVAPDGRVILCDTLRDPDGCAMWIAVPREEIPLMGPGWTLAADALPAKSILDVRILMRPEEP